MLKNYITVGIRNILKYKVFSFINLFGLALAMSVCMLIILMLADQNRYDAFHQHKNRIYRILSDYNSSRMAYATTPFPLAKALEDEFSIVETATTLTPGPGGEAMYQQHLVEMRGYFADPSFFKVFSFDLVKGDKSTSLNMPNSMVISTTMAEKLFGNENPMGKVVDFSDRQLPFPIISGSIASTPVSWGSFTITGVMDEDKYKSHLKFDVLISAATIETLHAQDKFPDRKDDWEFFYQSYTYVLLHQDKSQQDLGAALASLASRHYSKIKSEEIKGFNFKSQSLAKIQLDLKANDTNNRLPRIGYYFLFGLAIVIMISACLNYTNLSIARALTRSKEIGVRKVTGAQRRDLLYQFLSESIVTTVLAMLLGVLMLLAIKPAFKDLWINQYLNFELPETFSIYGVFFAFAILIGCIAGVYPAWHLSGHQPIKALKNLDNKRRSGFGMRKVLSVSQFVISLFFITTSILIFRQFKYFLEFDYGFNPKNIVNVELQGADYRKVATLFNSVPDIEEIAGTDILPSTGRNNGMQIKKTGAAEFMRSGLLITDENFTHTLGIKLIAGKQLPSFRDTSDRFILVNEALSKKLGYKNPNEIVGEVLTSEWGNEPLEVVGVVEDFRFNLLINRQFIEPLIMRNQPKQFAFATVKISSHNLMGTVAKLEEKWKLIDPSHSFKYEFYDVQLATTHQAIFDLVSIIGFIAILAVTIACLGLLGMATYTAARRKKEVGIRKVLGAEEKAIVLLLSKEFFKVLLISILIAAPLSYFINNLWLQHLPTRVEFGFQTVLMATFILTFLGTLTIGSQTWRAAKSNPVDVLKES